MQGPEEVADVQLGEIEFGCVRQGKQLGQLGETEGRGFGPHLVQDAQVHQQPGLLGGLGRDEGGCGRLWRDREYQPIIGQPVEHDVGVPRDPVLDRGVKWE